MVINGNRAFYSYNWNNFYWNTSYKFKRLSEQNDN